MDEAVKSVSQRQGQSYLDRFVTFLSSVRFGVVMLCILVLLSVAGMLVVQQNVEGFESYYSSLTPAEKVVFSYLGIFDIYHSWYFNGLLLILSLNIVLASIDHFPAAWKYISHPKKEATKAWLKNQRYSEVIARPLSIEKALSILKKSGFKSTVTEKNGRTHIFGESGKWNRLGAYIVHVSLLTLFLGHFLALQTGFDADVQFEPGQATDQIRMIQLNLDNLKDPNADIRERFAMQLPFTITCTDIQQKLIDPKGSIEIPNTMDWRTRIKIDDPQYGETIADVSLNKPFSYRGYRFFQASAITEGKAREMKIEAIPEAGGEPVMINLARNGSADMPGGVKIEYDNFWSDFEVGQDFSRTNVYKNPALRMKVSKDGETKQVYAFAGNIGDNIPIGKPQFGYKFKLKEFEKVPVAHVLSIKYDPFHGHFAAWYIGGFGLIGALIFVFFFSHRRLWVLIDEKESIIGGNTNRNHQAFEDTFGKISGELAS